MQLTHLKIHFKELIREYHHAPTFRLILRRTTVTFANEIGILTNESRQFRKFSAISIPKCSKSFLKYSGRRHKKCTHLSAAQTRNAPIIASAVFSKASRGFTAPAVFTTVNVSELTLYVSIRKSRHTVFTTDISQLSFFKFWNIFTNACVIANWLLYASVNFFSLRHAIHLLAEMACMNRKKRSGTRILCTVLNLLQMRHYHIAQRAVNVNVYVAEVRVLKIRVHYVRIFQ